MNYHIVVSNGGIIASFEHEQDRDIAFDALVDYWGQEAELMVEDSDD